MAQAPDRASARGPTVGALVVSFQGGDKVIRCLRALEAQSYPLQQIVLVDNASSDGTAARVSAELPAVRVLALEENRGLSVARNLGLRALETDLALSIDHDVYAEPDCVDRLVSCYRRLHPAVLCPRLVLEDRSTVDSDGGWAHFLGTLGCHHRGLASGDAPAATRAVGAVPGGCMLLDRKPVLQAGGFDEDYFFNFEDLELSLRLRSRGQAIVCEPAAVAMHDRGSGSPGFSFRRGNIYPRRRAFLVTRNRWLTLLIHYRRRTLLALAPALLIYEVAAVLFALTRGVLGQWSRAWLSLWRDRREIGARRRRSSAARTRPDRELIEGGAIPLASGLLRSRPAATLTNMLGRTLNAYWALARHWID